jgi:hypothetical protein
MANAFYNKALQKMLAGARIRVTGATNATPIVITTDVAHGLSNGNSVTIRGVTGNTNANVLSNQVGNVGTSTFELTGVAGNGNYDSGTGEVFLTSAQWEKNPNVIRWGLDIIKVDLVNVTNPSGYVFSASHEFLSSINIADRPYTAALSNLTATDGVADADDATFTSVASGTFEAFVIYKDTGVASTSPLIAYFDTSTGLPLTASGGSVTIAWNNGANKIFKI